tara:strand:- start:2643 stop:3131 length:489 start_codon:yes stop_codon:yes gene_type:complete
MKKIIYLVLILFSTTFINGCSGYKPIFSSTNLNFKISDYTVEGDKVLGNKIYSKLYGLSSPRKEDPSIKIISLIIDSSKTKSPTSKDTSGKILEYKIILTTKIQVKDFTTKNNILDQTFTSSISYRVQDQFSETVTLENKSLENLINKTYEEILIKLSQNIS